MKIDLQNVFSQAQAITASALSTNVMDLMSGSSSTPMKHIGVGAIPIFLVVLCTVAMTDSNSDSTVAVTLVNGATSTPSTTIQTIGTFAALSAAGTRMVVPLVQTETPLRYLGVYYTVANGNLTTGSFWAFLTPNPDLYTAYPNNFNVG